MWSQWESKNKRMFSHSRMENWNKWKPTIKVASSHINLVYVMFRMHKNTYTRINVYQPTYILQNDIMIIHPFWFGYINFHKYILYFIVFIAVSFNKMHLQFLHIMKWTLSSLDTYIISISPSFISQSSLMDFMF